MAVVQPARSKIDVVSMLNEDTRATVTEECRTKALTEAVGGFERRISKEEREKL